MWMLIVLSVLGTESLQTAPIRKANFAAFPAPEYRAPNTASRPTRFSESSNFIVHSYLPQPEAEDVARYCETLCCHLHRLLLGEDQSRVWQPKCEVVLHPSRTSYLQAVGRGGGETVGSSAIRIKSGKILHRRIDLLADDQRRSMSALRHELIHVLFAELFPGEAPPRWAEEGLALLHDSHDKQERHLDDLRTAVKTRTTIPLHRLFATADYPTGWQRAVFYGQSISVAGYLTQLNTPEQFLHFVQLCLKEGHEVALRKVYRIESLAELERGWHHHVAASTSRTRTVD
jgi:hypothetical protein